ncbi:putative enzyme [Klebsiella michiganensis]|uniref:Putative enzyme n=1 Tax=Klebsiella michiganensis TaxID=1134687 RepID=A0A7H4M610_9ENTR|nr:putative enzyme [Klebsiella michiganensis]
MTRLTAKDFPQQLLEYYDYYAHGKISNASFSSWRGSIPSAG